MKKIKHILPFIFTFANLHISTFTFAQHYSRTDSIKVEENGNWLKNPWVGGHNYIQISSIDMNMDGIKDLFVFDRSGDKITCYINKGTPNQVDYVDETSTYASKFPHMEEWALLKDYDGDGKEDIFTYPVTGAGIKVYKNISTPSSGLQFTLVKLSLQATFCNDTAATIFMSSIDIPSIEDIDGDGDLDILGYGSGMFNYPFNYYINQSEELGYGRDSLIFKLDCDPCWGNFHKPSANTCSVTIAATGCRMMSDSTLHALPALPKTSENDLMQGKSSSTSMDGGDCALCLDLDGDGDKDILIGGIGCCKFIALTNGGSAAAANMVSQDDNFPSYNIPVNMYTFPCGYYVDVNNDNKRDLIVAPNAPGNSIDNENIWYYENIGTDIAPVFSRQTKSLFQEDMIDVGEGSDPVFFDFDNDGLTDILISNYEMVHDSCAVTYRYGVWAFKNIGTASDPKFNLTDTNYADLSNQLPALLSKHLTFGDIDGDGDMDMFVGDNNGNLQYFENTAGAGNPANFVLTTQNYPDATGNSIDVGSNATPQLIDVDRDGKLDIIIGKYSGGISYYRNTGTTTSPVFSLVTNSFGGVHTYPLACCKGWSVPFMYDSAGSYRMLVGSEANRSTTQDNLGGWIYFYKNIDGNLGGNFTLVDSMYQHIWEGTRMMVNGKDINNDGKMDLIIGNYCGGATIYTGDTLTTGVAEIQNPSFDFDIYPNPTNGMFNVKWIMDNGQLSMNNYQLSIYNVMGECINQQIIKSPNQQIDLSEAKNGIYFCKISCNGFSKTKKLVLIK